MSEGTILRLLDLPLNLRIRFLLLLLNVLPYPQESILDQGHTSLSIRTWEQPEVGFVGTFFVQQTKRTKTGGTKLMRTPQ